MRFGLSEETISGIQQVFARYPDIDRVVLYGSRAMGNFRPGSDIDLTLYGERLDRHLCSSVAEDLDDLLLPYSIDLSIFALLAHPDLEAHIERVGQLFYGRTQI